MKITFLGTGTSTGVPQIGCQCKVCRSTDSRDKRLRTSVMIEIAGKKILIDCGPDFREQMLRYYPGRIDAVLITHEHFDHVGGLDELRPFCYPEGLSVYAEDYTIDRLEQRIPYCFAENPYPGVPRFITHKQSLEPFNIEGIVVIPIRLMHYKLPIFGYRIGNMAYLTDMKSMPETEYRKLKGVDTLIINGLRQGDHLSHQSLENALRQIEKIHPQKSYIIHMSHEMGLHAEVERILPANVHLAYDGLVVEST